MVRIVDGINKYVTEMSEETLVESIGERRVQGNLSRRQNHNRHQIQRFSSVSIPYHERKWIDVEQGTFDQNCLEVAKIDEQIAAT